MDELQKSMSALQLTIHRSVDMRVHRSVQDNYG